MNHSSKIIAAAAALAPLALASVASAQFDNISPGLVRERISGMALPGLSASDIQAGDQLGAFFDGQIVGSFTFSTDTGNEFRLTITGDNPNTPQTEGPDTGDVVEIRFFDASSNFVYNAIRVETAGGERFNLTFQGQEVPNIPGFPIDLTPTRNFNVRITEGGGSGGGSGGGDGGGGGNPGRGLDVNGDGEVNRLDVSTVIRAIAASNVSERSGAASRVRDRLVTAEELQAADVNDDGVVSTQDVMTIIRGIRASERPTSDVTRPSATNDVSGNTTDES